MSWITTPLRRSLLFKLLVMTGIVLLLQACGGGGKSTPAPTAPTAPVSHWIWVSGSNDVDQAGNYGATAASTNVPGARNGAVSWADSSNILWIFGGSGYDSVPTFGPLNDLWKFDPVSGLWTWVSGNKTVDQAGNYGIKGTADAANVPGARYSAISWTDSSDTLWMFGGYGRSAGTSGRLNDLWKFDRASGRWTWVSGSNTVDQASNYGTKGTASSTNAPGARNGAISWTDSSNILWMFGGYGYDSAPTFGRLNDLWKFDPVSGLWTWVSGNKTVDQAGNYGIKGTADAANVPGARYSAISWTDSSDTLWMFGGYGNDSAGTIGFLNDLWKFDPTSGQWTWISGSNTKDQPGDYGNQGVTVSSNVPGARGDAVSWIDSNNTLKLFGGSAGKGKNHNDLWQFNPATGHWTWISGSNTVEQTGSYGTKGMAAVANVPGARNSAIHWTDNNHAHWLFGGSGYASTGSPGTLNDLWRFVP